MKTVIIIPARYASSRYPGKPLVALRDVHGGSKPLIQRTWDAARQVAGVEAIYIATDDLRIKQTCESFGADVVMTSEDCRNGTERCSDALRELSFSPDIVINFQGDAPLTPPWFVEALIAALKEDSGIDVATPILRCDVQTHQNFMTDRKNGRVGGTTAVFDRAKNALYFSKEVLPYTGDVASTLKTIPVFHHVGVYAYRPSALEKYMAWPPTDLENLEGLEQLRFLENQTAIRCVEVEARGREFWELNNPVDVARIEAVLGK